MEKKSYKYRLTLEGVETSSGAHFDNSPIQFTFENHDDLFRIMNMAKGQPIFDHPNDNTEFFIGLKLFSEVLLRNRKSPNPMTAELYDAVGNFMRSLKSR